MFRTGSQESQQPATAVKYERQVLNTVHVSIGVVFEFATKIPSVIFGVTVRCYPYWERTYDSYGLLEDYSFLIRQEV